MGLRGRSSSINLNGRLPRASGGSQKTTTARE
jgi:hypothetical protein